MMKKIQPFLITLAASAIMACSRDNSLPGGETDPATPSTTEAFASFTISVPKGIQAKSTKATTDAGTADETAVKTLDVFIYDVASPHTPTVAYFSTAQNTLLPTSTGWKTATPILTLKADKYIFVGVNLNAAITNEITSKGLGAFSPREFAQSVSDLTSATNGFVMFNDAYPAVTSGNALSTTKEEAAANPISISVSRVIAKAAVSEGENFVVNGGGSMQNIVYGWRNINKSFYFIQNIENNLIKDYNWDSYNTNDFVRGSDTIPVNLFGASITKFSYALENSFNYVAQVSLVDEATFLSIRGQFKPNQIIQIKTGTTTAVNSDDFEIITNPNSYGTFYVVRTDDNVSNYFIKGTDAEQYATLCQNNAPGMPALSGGYTLSDNTYVNGLCYFHVLVNSSATTPYTPYGIYRNQYYRVTLNSIQAPGNPNDNFDKGQVIQPNTWVNVDITVNEWEVIDEDHDI